MDVLKVKRIQDSELLFCLFEFESGENKRALQGMEREISIWLYLKK